jgi:membrane protein YdbS with pleckstrin-like domain
VRNPGIQFKVWAMMIATAVIACFLAVEIFLFDFATQAKTPRWSEVFMLWIAINLPIVVVPLLLAYAYFYNQKCDDLDGHVDDDQDG